MELLSQMINSFVNVLFGSAVSTFKSLACTLFVLCIVSIFLFFLSKTVKCRPHNERSLATIESAKVGYLFSETQYIIGSTAKCRHVMMTMILWQPQSARQRVTSSA